METALTCLGLGIALGTLAAILWSVAHPSRRLWPPDDYTTWTPFLVWIPTFTLFGILIVLGILGWGSLPLPAWVRFGLGVPLILFGNAAVWLEVSRFGIAQTGGAVGELRTGGLYRHSRNPQYVADLVMILGWMLFSAAPLVSVVGGAAILALLAAPFAEEPWLRAQYGSEFEGYASRVRRFL
ncbi:methyltransferase family protein [Dinoroseobacter sp. S76]|uniref:methyltransferase family protein n=1 Tax=Dinoroseobacter sp. S76 TaxID=3415124 RepID=UPI003C79958E